MPFTIDVERNESYVRFAVAGPASLKNYFDLIDEAARITLASGERHALVDLRLVRGRLHADEQAFIGETVVQKLSHLARVATVVPDDPQTYRSETVAREKGFDLRSFADEAEAAAWLRSDSPS